MSQWINGCRKSNSCLAESLPWCCWRVQTISCTKFLHNLLYSFSSKIGTTSVNPTLIRSTTTTISSKVCVLTRIVEGRNEPDYISWATWSATAVILQTGTVRCVNVSPKRCCQANSFPPLLSIIPWMLVLLFTAWILSLPVFVCLFVSLLNV